MGSDGSARAELGTLKSLKAETVTSWEANGLEMGEPRMSSRSNSATAPLIEA